MADSPVDTTTDDNQAENTAADTPEAPASEPAADAPAEKKAPPKKKTAKKATARKETAKKAAKKPAKKAAPKPDPEAAADEAPTEAAPAEAAPAEAAPAEEAPAEATSAEETGAADTMLLFQAPEKTKAPARRRKKQAEPAPEKAEDVSDDVEDKQEDAVEADPTGEDSEDSEDSEDAEDTEDAEDAEDAEGGAGGARRRRRRGGRRRRKSGGGGDADTKDEDAGGAPADTKTDAKADKAGDKAGDKAESADADGGDQGEGGQSSSSRRRRRRRREGEGGEGGDDTPNTVTKVRKPRSAEDEITAVSGSTRLEAKKQRRREGREAGRRRAPIISEAEFLARRESVERVMVVRQRKDLTQIAVMEDKVLVEHYVARESQTSLIGNVYLGRVQNVLPSMEAAFIDIGKGRNAVLYAGEVNWSALGHKEGTPRKIESVLSSGQTVLVQVTKDPIGHKGARLTSQISLAGRFLVYVPDGTTSGISRKLPDTERGRLKTLLKEIVPESAGVIVRTAAEGAAEDELTRDVERLKARWEDIESKAAKGSSAPKLLYGEPDLTLKVVRDLFTEDFAKLVVQGSDAWETVHGYVEHVAPDLADRLEHYETDAEGAESRPDVFATYRIDEQIAKGLDRKVWLPSGGSLIIDRTEAMTVIDVNTGKFTGSGGNLEETVTKNNLEAAEEIVRQLRLRDIGGIIVVDFIDMVLESNRDLVLRRLVECLGRDRTRHQVAEVTSLGLVQMTRKRIGTGLLEAFSETCDHCQGRGLIVHDLPIEPRRGGGEEESRRSGRRRRGKGSQPDESAPKAVPSPKDVAAMAKPPAEHDDELAAEAEEPDADGAQPLTEDSAPKAEQPATEVDEAVVTEPPAPEPVVEKPVTKVVTRSRRRAASRPAGPPAAVEEAEPEQPAQPAADAPKVDEPAADEQSPGAEEPVVGAIGAPADDGVVEPNVGELEPGLTTPDPEPAAEEPHVEHVPIKKKGTRKR